MLKKYSEKDADLSLLKDKIIAVIGYGSQGDAQANCMKDSGLNVVVGLRLGKSWDKAVKDGHKVVSVELASKKADIIHILLPDEVHGEVYNNSIKKYLNKGKTLSFSHGFSITYGTINPPKDVNVIMVAPLAPGTEERRLFLEGSGVPCLVVVKQDTGNAREIVLALAKACGFLRVGAFECTFEQETHQDLFSEQAVLCGGMIELVKAAYDEFISRGYPPELGYFILHETKLITNLITQYGIEGMYEKVSNTAEYGGRTVGAKIIDESTRKKIKEALDNVINGKFANEWLEECKSGMPVLKKMRKSERDSSIESVGKEIRKIFNTKH